MRYYLVRPLKGIREPEILNYNEVIPYRAFLENKPWKINKQTVCIFQKESDLESMLLSPFPLFGKELKPHVFEVFNSIRSGRGKTE